MVGGGPVLYRYAACRLGPAGKPAQGVHVIDGHIGKHSLVAGLPQDIAVGAVDVLSPGRRVDLAYPQARRVVLVGGNLYGRGGAKGALVHAGQSVPQVIAIADVVAGVGQEGNLVA